MRATITHSWFNGVKSIQAAGVRYFDFSNFFVQTISGKTHWDLSPTIFVTSSCMLRAAPHHSTRFQVLSSFFRGSDERKKLDEFLLLHATTSLNLQAHSTTVIEQHTAHISYNGQGKNQHLDLGHVIYQSNETGDYGSFFVSNAWFLPLCTPHYVLSKAESLLGRPQ